MCSNEWDGCYNEPVPTFLSKRGLCIECLLYDLGLGIYHVGRKWRVPSDQVKV